MQRSKSEMRLSTSSFIFQHLPLQPEIQTIDSVQVRSTMGLKADSELCNIQKFASGFVACI